MGDYYNKTRAPIGIALRRGGSVAVAPKTWCFIPPEDEGSVGLADAVRKGFLVRALVPITVPSTPVAAVVPAPAAVSASPVPVANPKPTVTMAPEVAASSVAKAESKTDPVASNPPVFESKQSRRNK